MTFDYAETWLKNPAAVALSHSLPLTKKHSNRNECRGFFAGILPEESKREIVAHNLGISAKNDYAMLEKIGRECAGAVTFLPAGTELPKREDNYRALTDKELAEILKALPRRPLMAGDEGVRLAPLYDLLSTSYYPELSPKMAMKIGGENLSTPITVKHFEQLAEEARLAKPMVKRRVPELAELILSKMLSVTTDHPVVLAVAKLIQGNCDRTIKKFKL